MTFASQLASHGHAVIELGDLLSLDFVAKFDDGMKSWFDSNLRRALDDDRVPEMKSAEKMHRWRSGRQSWCLMSEAKMPSLMILCDLTTPLGWLNVFDSSRRKTAVARLVDAHHTGDNGDNIVDYLCDRILYTKQGNSRNGQAKLSEAVLNNGFGLTAHLIPSAGVKAMEMTLNAMRTAGINVRYNGVPHLIAKPPNGEALAAHSDGPRPQAMIAYLESLGDLLQSATNLDWARKWGVQTLIHHAGGRADGETYAIGDLTPFKYYVCLVAIRDRTLGLKDADMLATGTVEDWLTRGTGPSFLKWDSSKVLGALNVKLAQNGLSSIRKVAIRPPSDAECSFSASWLLGYPHGSNRNKQRRVSSTAPFEFVSHVDVRDPRLRKRVRDLAIIASTNASADSKEEAEQAIASDKKPMCGGKTHLHPERAAKWIRRHGHFNAICVTLADADRFDACW